jgi:hypothetical protein
MKRALILKGLLLSCCAFGADQRLDGIWVGAEKLSLTNRTDCPIPDHGGTGFTTCMDELTGTFHREK